VFMAESAEKQSFIVNAFIEFAEISKDSTVSVYVINVHSVVDCGSDQRRVKRGSGVLWGQVSDLFIIEHRGIVIFIVNNASVMPRLSLLAVVFGVESKFVYLSRVTSKNIGIERVAESIFKCISRVPIVECTFYKNERIDNELFYRWAYFMGWS